ncbi:PilT protein domain protein [Vulcanisaeta moutnovskia 768-28]|uniref:PilT protein domain protein n=1 Tax=Vulcanisaeta moutnovskia (strain 768-28) TaxID=985053 RepID=F0QSV5_VULM7|nr:type II toxin-antitoxin system VapC family toxin [Vulcanisaeta moutnovskia]ADY00376.1 PilT protein domain protein [Vulcanisaeta moutnovskia 768-28]
MSLVFDASAIIRLVELKPDKAVNALRNQYTVDLAYHEIGNYLWKISKLTSINIESLLKAFNSVISLMNVISIGLNSDAINLARRMNITYYDATYVYLTLKLNAKLVTEDKELMTKFPNITISIEEL